jgi:hypothetical protein
MRRLFESSMEARLKIEDCEDLKGLSIMSRLIVNLHWKKSAGIAD